MSEPLEIAITYPRLDAAAAPELKSGLAETFAGHPTRVLLDLTAVEFIDSTGLGVLVSMLKQMGPGGRVAVVGANATVRRLFEITRLDKLFALNASVDEARQALAG